MKKKRNGFIWLFGIALFLLLPLFAIPISAGEYTFEGAGNGLSDLYDSLPGELQAELSELQLDNPAEAAEGLAEKLDPSYWVDQIINGLADAVHPALRSVANILGILILTATVKLLSETISGGAVSDTFRLCSDVCVASAVLSVSEGMVSVATGALERLCTVMNLMIPMTEAVCLTEGAITQLTVHRSAMLLYIGIAGNLNQLVLKPLFGVLFAFAVVTSIFGQFGLSGLIGGIRKGVMLVISLCTMLFSFVLGLQTVLARSADSLGLKTLRLALGSFVPIVGGTLSEALATVKEGFGALRSITGIGGVIIILLLVLPAVISLSANSILLSFCHTVADLLGCQTSATVIGEMRSVLSILCAIVYATSLLFVMAMFLFAQIGGSR